MTAVAAAPLILDDLAEQPAVLGALAARNREQLDAARAMLAARRCVRLAGIGSSRHAAGIAAAAFERGGMIATVLDGPGVDVERAPLVPGDALILVSQSGETPALLRLAAEAREAAVPVVAVVNAGGSRLSEIADVTLDCGAGAERVVAATKSLTAQILALRLLASPKAAPEHLGALTKAVDVALAAPVTPLKWRQPRMVVAGGFAAQAVADEIALKLAEVSGLTCASESLIDYLHGPVAAAEPALAFVGREANRAAIERLGHVQVIDVEAPAPRTGDSALDSITTIVLGQRLAVELALTLGADPDSARGLAKVTQTR